MIELGKINILQVKKLGPIGALLSDLDDENDEVRLPAEEVPEDSKVGDKIEVFIYKDTDDVTMASITLPKLELGEVAYLRVVDISKVGAFLDWGLKKDLFLPYKEQKTEVRKGRGYLVGLYIDKSDRLCATMDIYKVLRSDSPYQKNDKAEGIVYDIKPDMGAFVAIDHKYHGLILKNELFGNIAVGDDVEVRVINVREDGKLDLSLREKAYLQMDTDAENIIEKLNVKDGVLYLNDDSSPEDIKMQLGMSKKAFKRAVGRLLKEGKIEFIEAGIKKI